MRLICGSQPRRLTLRVQKRDALHFKCSKEKLTLTRLNFSSAHPETVYEGTPTENCKDQAVFDEGAVPSLSG